MTVLTSVPTFTSVTMVGLDRFVLPWKTHLLEGLEDSQFNTAQVGTDDKYVVKSITGLEPPDRTPAIAQTASGGSFQGIQTEDREIVLLIGLEPDWDAGETPAFLRNNLYTMMYGGYDPYVDFQLNAGIFPLAHQRGYLSKFEAAIFDQNPAVQLTFTMLNPLFKGMSQIKYDPTELNEKNPNVYNPATAETGFQFAVKFTDDLNGWYIKQSENQSVGMVFNQQFHDGDILTVNTIEGKRYIHLKPHRKKVQNKMGILSGSSEWIQLHPGNNHFVVPKKNSKWDWNGSLTFTPMYAGV